MSLPDKVQIYLSSKDRQNIQNEARRVQLELWNHRGILWPHEAVTPFDVLRPSVAAHVMGLNYEEHETLGNFGYQGKKFKVAGMLDRPTKKIAISLEFPAPFMRFTGAHEIGHWQLHTQQTSFRDRAIDSIDLNADAKTLAERQADYFAACFLIPVLLLLKEFKDRFGVALPLVIDDTVAFHLNPHDSHSLLWADNKSLERELAVASCTSFNGNNFQSLAERFGVSNKAMAIRIHELDLIRWP